MHDQPASGSEEKATPALTDDQKQYLLSLARNAIAAAVSPLSFGQDEDVRPAAQAASGTLQNLSEMFAGVFVSLHVDQALRGCIGYLDAIHPLPEAIQETAMAAALRDPRFEPLRDEELEQIDIEISVLSSLEKIAGPADITIGKDGLMVRCDRHQGVLLPQVAARAGLSAQAFLEHTCLKAGLPKNAWTRPETEAFRFRAEVFGEKLPPDR